MGWTVNLLITTGIFPPDIGGPATYVPTIAKAFIERGHNITVVTTSEPEHLTNDDSVYPFPVIRLNRRLPIWRRLFHCVREILRVGKRTDVIYANGIYLETALANKLLRKPLVMKIVGDEAWERATRKKWTDDNFEDFQVKGQSWRAELLKRMRSWYVKQADKIITPSQYLARWVERWGISKERIEVIYNAVEPMDKIKPASVPLQTPLKAVTVGRLVPWKRVDGILEAVAQIPELGLVVVGDGPERARLERKAASLGISERVYFAGQLSREETLSLMATCDIFVLNSTYEGLPHVVLEAMALGLPVVATAVGGTPEVVKDGETGMLVLGQNGTVKASLSILTHDPVLRRRLGEAARQWVSEHFSMEHMIMLTEKSLFAVTERFA
ncbi:MAG: glycosyltransferase family 4 protein [Candidatus Fervidibacter sp.]|uniref:glycosyltransferase family 4 protein n=1 Tax=Candidatus Fervidibacter sp. TaxID=3100871 RepID=UPI00404A210D